MVSTWETGFSQQSVRNAGRLVCRVSAGDINGYKLLTSSHGVSHTVNIDDLLYSGRDGAKPGVHGEHAMGEAGLQNKGGREGGLEVE